MLRSYLTERNQLVNFRNMFKFGKKNDFEKLQGSLGTLTVFNTYQMIYKRIPFLEL